MSPSALEKIRDHMVGSGAPAAVQPGAGLAPGRRPRPPPQPAAMVGTIHQSKAGGAIDNNDPTDFKSTKQSARMYDV